MKKISLYIILLLAFSAPSCKKFLEVTPDGILTRDNFYKDEDQIRAAVNGAYLGLNRPFVTDLGVATSPVFSLEYMTGYCDRPRAVSDEFLQLSIDPANNYLNTWWGASFFPIENCNSIIASIQNTQVVDETAKNKFLAETYFLRAYYYFQAVRLFGQVPLKTTPTTDLNNTNIGLSSIEEVYAQIVSDLTTAEQAELPWTDKTGHVSKGAVKSLLAEVYITMAGYPLNKGAEYYQKAYDKSQEVIQSNQFSLFDNYSELRNPAKYNEGEHIFMIQHDENTIPNIMHFTMMPYPEVPISKQPSYSGAMAPALEFYGSYLPGDIRTNEKVFYYTRHAEYGNPSNIINLPRPYIYKYWNDAAEISGRDGSNFSLIRYADILLLSAEAKASLDGGTTTDAAAIDAYYQVHQRAFPLAVRPLGITLDEVLKERFWELAFEFHTWYDMQRTRKAFDVSNNTIVNIIGYKAPVHPRAFKESDLLWPIPLTEIQKNPNLGNLD